MCSRLDLVLCRQGSNEVSGHCRRRDSSRVKHGPPGQVGAAFVVNGRFAGLDLLAGPDLLARLLPKLVRSYALDAIDGDESGPRDEAFATEGMLAIQAALHAVAHMTQASHPAIGSGKDLRLKGDGLMGGALIAEGALVHLGIWSASYH